MLVSSVYGREKFATLPLTDKQYRKRSEKSRRANKNADAMSPDQAQFVSSKKSKLARRMRSKPTKSEAVMWWWLKKLRLYQIRFRTQVVVFGWIADFYCDEHKLVVEVDGSVHDSPKQIEYDAHRNKVMREAGLTVLRFPADRVMKDAEAIAAEIRQHCTVLRSPKRFTREQRICGLQCENPPRSPGNRYSGSLVGAEGKRSSTEHAVGAANPRRGMNSRASEACTPVAIPEA